MNFLKKLVYFFKSYKKEVKALRRYSKWLNSINKPEKSCRIFYEYFSGALIWEDEFDKSFPNELIDALRLIFAYRTSLMLNDPRHEFEYVWNKGLSLSPHWIGFLPERRKSDKELIDIYNKGLHAFEVEMEIIEKCLDNKDSSEKI